MAHEVWSAGVNTNLLRDTWDAEIGLDPTEETKIADWVEQPIGAQKFGNNLYLRKLPALSATTFTSSSNTAALRAGLTWSSTGDTRVTAAATMKYSAVGLERAMLNRAVEDSAVRNGLKKQMMAAIREGIDVSLFALATSLSETVSQADIDDAAVRTALGQLATRAEGKFTEDSPKLLVVHPSELKNVWNIPAIKEYQIRGTIGAAVNAKLNAYGLVWRESGNVKFQTGSYYNPLLLKDAWALAYNEKPHILDVQFDGLSENFIAVTEFGCCEWFDTSGVAIVTS